MPEPLTLPVAVAASAGPVLGGPSGAPVLVLGNSLGTSTRVWDCQVTEFRRHFRVVRYDLPGHGGSPAPAAPYTIAGLGSGVLALLDSLGVGRFAYCGISLGGMIGSGSRRRRRTGSPRSAWSAPRAASASSGVVGTEG
jgi:pimeloyl-ACP methyl ester carboxylesterase